MNIFDAKFPGNLGPIRGSLISVLHADWPAYPQGEDFFESLFQLTAFPKNTSFKILDDIDKSHLFMAEVPCSKPDDPFNKRNFHIAIWHKDLAVMQSKEFIDGAVVGNEYEWRQDGWNRMIEKIEQQEKSFKRGVSKLGYRHPDTGEFIETHPPKEEDFVDDGEEFTIVPSRNISVTDKGRQYIYNELQDNGFDISDSVSSKVFSLYNLEFYDTCVREACVQLESRIKNKISSDRWGDKLTDEFIKYLRETNQYYESYVRTFSQELRTLFKLIRNDYMHNLVDVDEITAFTILYRVARVQSILQKN